MSFISPQPRACERTESFNQNEFQADLNRLEIETKHATTYFEVTMTILPHMIVITFEREVIKRMPLFRVPCEEEFKSI